MKKTNYFLVVLLVLFLISCGNSKKKIDEVQKRGDRYFKINSDETYSGLIYSPFNEELNYFEKEIKDGKINGEVKYWYENGQKKYLFEFIDNKINGMATAWYDNGSIKFTGEYLSGEPNGYVRFFDNDMDTLFSELYKDGKMIERKEFYPNGKLKISKNSKGLFEYHYNDGSLLFSGNYKEGSRNGAWKEYYKNGKLKLDAYFKNDLKDGSWKYFDKDGQIIFNVNFNDNLPDSTGFALANKDTLNFTFFNSESYNCKGMSISGVDYLRGLNYEPTQKLFVNMSTNFIALSNLLFYSIPHFSWGAGMDIFPYDIEKKELWGKGSEKFGHKEVDLIDTLNFNEFTSYAFMGNSKEITNRYRGHLFNLVGIITKIGSKRYSDGGEVKIFVDSLYFQDTTFKFRQDIQQSFSKILDENKDDYMNLLESYDFSYTNDISDLISEYDKKLFSSIIQEITGDEQSNNYDKSINGIKIPVGDCDKFLEQYRKFVDGYIDIIDKYKENPDNVKLMNDYSNLLLEYQNWDEQAESCKNDPNFSSKFMRIQSKIIEKLEGLKQ
jgi:antitoxin component YwqK of YwqJK toxin-antitoxin module